LYVIGVGVEIVVWMVVGAVIGNCSLANVMVVVTFFERVAILLL